MSKRTTTRPASPRDTLAFRGVSLRLDDETEARLDLLALRLGLQEGARVSGRRGKAARIALLHGLALLEAQVAQVSK